MMDMFVVCSATLLLWLSNSELYQADTVPVLEDRGKLKHYQPVCALRELLAWCRLCRHY